MIHTKCSPIETSHQTERASVIFHPIDSETIKHIML